MTSVLLLIDVQRNMLQPPAPVPAAASVSTVIEYVLGKARSAGAATVHVRNNGGEDDPDVPGSPGWELVYDVRDGEHVIDKDKPDAFAGTALSELIPASAELVVVGMQSEYCIRETSLSALRRGHRVTLVHGAHATYDGEVPAGTTSRRIEEELGAAGVSVIDPAAVEFSAAAG
jgi:nicotinamidase-related amidase